MFVKEHYKRIALTLALLIVQMQSFLCFLRARHDTRCSINILFIRHWCQNEIVSGLLSLASAQQTIVEALRVLPSPHIQVIWC